MTNLLQRAIGAHGGLRRWSQTGCIHAHANIAGQLWERKRRPDAIGRVCFQANPLRQHAQFILSSSPGMYRVFEGSRVAIQSLSGDLVAERPDAPGSFRGHTPNTPWDDLHLAYFTGVLLWSCLTAPFHLTMPGIETAEAGPWSDGGETWHRLRAAYPPCLAAYGGEQTFYIDGDGLLRRLDCRLDIGGGTPLAHYFTGHAVFDGIVFPTGMRVCGRQADGSPVLDPPVLTVAVDDVQLAGQQEVRRNGRHAH